MRNDTRREEFANLNVVPADAVDQQLHTRLIGAAPDIPDLDQMAVRPLTSNRL
jgi:hypothetical protein